jgi:hypothetical protein
MSNDGKCWWAQKIRGPKYIEPKYFYGTEQEAEQDGIDWADREHGVLLPLSRLDPSSKIDCERVDDELKRRRDMHLKGEDAPPLLA